MESVGHRAIRQLELGLLCLKHPTVGTVISCQVVDMQQRHASLPQITLGLIAIGSAFALPRFSYSHPNLSTRSGPGLREKSKVASQGWRAGAARS